MDGEKPDARVQRESVERTIPEARREEDQVTRKTLTGLRVCGVVRSDL